MTARLTHLALLCLCALPVWLLLRRPWKRPIVREIALGLFAVFMAGMLIMALDGQWAHPANMLASARSRIANMRGIRLTPFMTIRQQLNTLAYDESRTQLLGNTLLFMPWGFFLPLLWRRYRGVLRMAGMCLLLTLFIECTQLFINRTVDIDDILLNFAGSMTGALGWWLLHRIWPKLDQHLLRP